MEIERKYLVGALPFSPDCYPCKVIEQAYISTNPVIRVRRSNDRFVLTVKSKGLLAREEFELDIDEAAYRRLCLKAEGTVVTKNRYVIPLLDTEGTTGDRNVDERLLIELDIFTGVYKGLIYAEVEFPSEETAASFQPPEWFDRDVTMDGSFHNSSLSSMNEAERKVFLKGAKVKS